MYIIFIFFIIILPVYEKYGNFKITGNPMDIMIIVSATGQIRNVFAIIICIITLVNYLFVGIITKFVTDLHHATIKKLYRSLYIIVFVNICTFLIFFVVAILLHSVPKLYIHLYFWHKSVSC
ncbi:unnamed protein product [Meloidogyne enterolobii]|uniref:Uncharacterized protein n=1 Tax=Meloidogyne enterolobii TaxID=390850 RepID=A0ACB0ZM82_MELEN